MRLFELLHNKPQRVVSLPPTASPVRAAALMEAAQVGAILICDEGRILGVLSERDLALAIHACRSDLFNLSVSDLMTVGAPSASPNDSVLDIMRLMTERRVRHMPVVEDDIVVGVVSIGDILKSRLAEKIQENAVLQDLARARFAV